MTTVERKNDESMMDIGQHCTICRRLDFLPYTCKECLKSYCNDHRVQYNEHECNKLRNELLKKKIDIDHLPPSKSLFPDLDKIRKEAEINAKTRNPIGQRLSNSTGNGELSTIEVALLRLKKFVGKKSSNTGKKIFNFVNLKNSTSVGVKMVEISKLKRSAKGDTKIPVKDRIFIYCIYVPDDNSIQKNEDENKLPVFVSKNWPIGRMLDSCTDLLKIKNLNNREIAKSEKLTIFRKIRSENESKDDEIFINIPASGRVLKEIEDGDVIYIVRGANV